MITWGILMKFSKSAIVLALCTISQIPQALAADQSEGVEKQLLQLERQVEELKSTLEKEQKNIA